MQSYVTIEYINNQYEEIIVWETTR
jgi:hypothetical protein